MDVRETLRPCRKSAREMMLCNTQENRGRSARDRRTVRQSNTQIFSWIWARSSSPPSSFPPRPETSGARPLAPPSPTSVDLPPPATILRFLARAPSPAPPPPSPTPSPASPGRNRPRHRRSPLEPLEALLHRRSASPVILRSNRLREWNRGESLGPPGLFPPPVVRAPAPVNRSRRRRRAYCCLSGGLQK